MLNLKITRWLCLILVSISIIALGSACSKQGKKEDYLKEADRYFDTKDLNKAEIEYLNVYRLEPANAHASKRLATIYFEQGKADRAVPFLFRARQLDGEDIEVRVRVGQIYYGARQYEKAKEEALYVLSRQPTNEENILLLSDLAQTPAEITEMQGRLEEVKDVADKRASWHLAMANLHLRQTNIVAAEAALQTAVTVEPESSRVHLAWGNFHWQQKDFKKAGEEYQKASDLAPTRSSARLRWAEFKNFTGATKEARGILQQIVQEAPDYTPALAAFARITFDQQHYQESSNAVAKILSLDSRNYDARLLQAGLKRTAGRTTEAIKDLEELKKVFPQSTEASFQLALAHLQNQDRPKATISLQEALTLDPNLVRAALLLAELSLEKGDAAGATTSLLEIIKKQPGQSRAQMLLGGAYAAQGRFDDARAVYEGLEKTFPTNATLPYLQGLSLRHQNQIPDARRAFQRASELAPGDPLVIYQLVDLEILEKNYPAAMQQVRSLLAKDPRSASAKFLEARIFLAQTNRAEAETALKRTVEWEPAFVSAYGLLARIYIEAKKLPQALEQLQQLADRDPKNAGARMLMGTVYEQTGDFGKAAGSYEQAIKVSPKLIPALNNLAYLLCEKLGKCDEAYAHAAKARELAPQDPSVADTLGWIHYRRGEYPRALTLLQESAAKATNQAEIQYHLGMAYYMMGEETQARAPLKRAVELSPDFPSRRDAQTRLAFLEADGSAATPAAISGLLERIRQQPDDLLALIRLGRAYQLSGATDKTLKVFEDAKKASPASVPVLVQLAQLYSANQKDPKQAMALAREARRLAPDDAQIAQVLGRLAYQSGDAEWGYSLLQESAQKRPSDPELLFDLAHASYSLGRIAEAEASMRRALATGPAFTRANDAQWFLVLIDYLTNSTKRIEAATQVQQLLNTKPDYLPAQMVAGLIQEQHGRFKDAGQAYEKILERSPQFFPARKELARLYTDQLNDQQKAFDYGTKAREALSEDAELAKTLGKIAYRRAEKSGLSEFQNAVRFLEESRRKRPDDAELLYYLGMAQYKLKAKEESKRALERALSLTPNSAFAPEAKRVLIDLKK